MRARELGIEIGLGRPGPLNAITDVAGVRVGCVTLVWATALWWSAKVRCVRASP